MKLLNMLLITVLLGGCSLFSSSSYTQQQIDCVDQFLETVGDTNGRIMATNIQAVGKMCKDILD